MISRKISSELHTLGLINLIGLLLSVWIAPKLWGDLGEIAPAPLFNDTQWIFWGYFFNIWTVSFAAVLAVVSRARLPLIMVVAVLLGLISQELVRMQAWSYYYLLSLSILLFSTKTEWRANLNSFRLLQVSVYIWSGIYKFNVVFITAGVQWLLSPFDQALPHPEIVLPLLGILIPLIETSLGAALLSRRLRNFSLIGLTAMHCGILISIGPFGHNWNMTVWPWNIVMIINNIILFRHSDVNYRDIIVNRSGGILHWLLITFAALAPAFHTVNLWPAYNSWAMYEGNVDRCTFKISMAFFQKLPNSLRNSFQHAAKGDRVYLQDWMISALGSPIPPEKFLYRKVLKNLCRFATSDEDIFAKITERSTILRAGNEYSLKCSEL